MANWNERDQDWRGARGWQEKSGARGSFGESRYEGGQTAGYNPAGPNQNYRQTDYGAGYGEDRSWNASAHDYGRDRNYGDGGARYGRGDYGGDQRRYGQGGGDRGRYGEERYGNQGYSGQGYGGQGYGGGYGVEWSDRDSYGSRSHDDDYRSGGYGYRGEYGGQRYGQDSYRGDYRRQGGRDAGFGDPNPYVQAATDGETRGPHRGVGPKDYKRSDDRIREDVNDRLTDDEHIDASGIQVQVKDGEVTLTGTVENRFAKRHAEDLAERISGARHVQNNLRVQENRWYQGQGDTSQTAAGQADNGQGSRSQSDASTTGATTRGSSSLS